MTAPKRSHPVSAYGPELLAALVRGGKEAFEIIFPDRKMAQRFAIRCNSLRQAMQREAHYDYPITSKCKVTPMWGERIGLQNDPDGKTKAVVRLAPRDSEFAGVLQKAGLELPPLEAEPPLADGTPLAPAEPEKMQSIDFDAFLDSIGKKP